MNGMESVSVTGGVTDEWARWLEDAIKSTSVPEPEFAKPSTLILNLGEEVLYLASDELKTRFPSEGIPISGASLKRRKGKRRRNKMNDASCGALSALIGVTLKKLPNLFWMARRPIHCLSKTSPRLRRTEQDYRLRRRGSKKVL